MSKDIDSGLWVEVVMEMQMVLGMELVAPGGWGAGHRGIEGHQVGAVGGDGDGDGDCIGNGVGDGAGHEDGDRLGTELGIWMVMGQGMELEM